MCSPQPRLNVEGQQGRSKQLFPTPHSGVRQETPQGSSGQGGEVGVALQYPTMCLSPTRAPSESDLPGGGSGHGVPSSRVLPGAVLSGTPHHRPRLMFTCSGPSPAPGASTSPKCVSVTQGWVWSLRPRGAGMNGRVPAASSPVAVTASAPCPQRGLNWPPTA